MRSEILKALMAVSLITLLLGAACTQQGEGGQKQGGEGEPETLVLATTTSTYSSGLLDPLNAAFEKKYNVRVEVHSVGTGAAIRYARDGEADVIMVHARGKEDKFLEDGFGVNRRNVMYNDFVIVGPKDDPAGIEGMQSAPEAFKKIAKSGETFVSRGDDSGTNAKELGIWEKAGVKHQGEWYQETGQGMGKTLTIANEKQAYTLSDRGTFLAYESKLGLEILVQGPLKGGDEVLANPYGVIAVNPAKYPERDYQLAMLYIGFLTSPQGQKIIEEYQKNGKQLFYPHAIREKENYNQYLPVTVGGLYNKKGEGYKGITMPPRG